MGVSRFINKDPQVAKEPFERVQKVMREINCKSPPLRERFKPRTRKSLGIRMEPIALLFPDPDLVTPCGISKRPGPRGVDVLHSKPDWLNALEFHRK